METRGALLSIVEQATRDPSSARRLLEMASTLVDQELSRGDSAASSGYVYAGAHTWPAVFENVRPEALPVPEDPRGPPLHTTRNQPQTIRVPFDCLIQGVSGWAIPRIPFVTGETTLATAMLLVNGDPDGRDLFSVGLGIDGSEKDFLTTGREGALVEPAVAILGTRRRPRPLAWTPQRGTLINVFIRNLTNVAVPSIVYEGQEEAGWPIDVTVEFHALNLETP